MQFVCAVCMQAMTHPVDNVPSHVGHFTKKPIFSAVYFSSLVTISNI